MKNKILDNLPAIFVCLVFIFGMTLVWNHAKAEDADYNLHWMQMPMMCGMPADVDRYIADNKFTPINVSFGKENAKEDGIMVFAITYYINDRHQTLAVAETPNDPYKCMIFHTFDMQMNTSLLPGLQT
tara:strand:- start:509 stop:892 length:384 start_codon:yes stop_codon:yes gene_type:complete